MSAKGPAAPPAVRSALLMTHEEPGGMTDAVATVVAASERHGCRLEMPAEDAVKDGAGIPEPGPEQPDLCIVLGGDGTILRALRRYALTGVPVFAINFGTIGFLATVDRDRLEEGLERALTRDFEVMSLPALCIGGGEPWAHNDITFTRQPHSRVAELAYSLAGEEIGHVRCDGLVAATPAGSTGYNLANNGPVLAWGVEGYAVSFIAPHTLTARSLVVAPGDVLHVRNEGARNNVDIALDGERVSELGPGEEVEVSFRDEVGRLAQLPDANFYHRMREKFGRLAH